MIIVLHRAMSTIKCASLENAGNSLSSGAGVLDNVFVSKCGEHMNVKCKRRFANC